MKKFLCGILPLLILLSLAGCAQKPSANTDMTIGEIAESIVRSQSSLPELERITAADADFSGWLSDYYLIPSGYVEDGVIYYAEGVEAAEIAVLMLTDEKNAESVQAALSAYMENRAGTFEGYAPQQAALAKGGIASANGRYAALLICEDVSEAKTAFLNCFTENNTSLSQAGAVSDSESQEKESEGYDSAAVLQAWREGDASALSEVDRRILAAAKDVIESEIDEYMNDYEKELAIHDFITGWSSFDYSVFGRSSSDGFADGSDTPYGVLIDKSAMCHGYSSTFQLFMDMLDIECITVFGTPSSSGVQHSWNMVKLDDEWYCVDCAWDDPIGGSPGHAYFNVTSDYLRRGSIHRWDESSVPEANGTNWAYGEH